MRCPLNSSSSSWKYWKLMIYLYLCTHNADVYTHQWMNWDNHSEFLMLSILWEKLKILCIILQYQFFFPVILVLWSTNYICLWHLKNKLGSLENKLNSTMQKISTVRTCSFLTWFWIYFLPIFVHHKSYLCLIKGSAFLQLIICS